MDRRQFIRAGSAASAASVLGLAAGCASTGAGAGGQVVVIGGGYGGATAAKYIRMWSEGRVQVTLVEPNDSFISCPISNLVLGGSKQMADITTSYDNLGKRHGVKIIKDRVVAIDADKRQVRLAGGSTLAYDRLVVSPGVDFMWDSLPGLKKPGAQDKVLHAWKAGAQTVALRQQLEAMPNGGVYALAIPLQPYRCPPGPYERASLVAHYLQQHKPRSKILLLDAKNNFSKKELFLPAWKTLYGDRIEWVSLAEDGQVVRVDARALEVETLFGTRHRADVLNVIPPQKAGLIAARAGVLDASGWAPVRGENFASKQVAGIHVLGDAALAGPMPKSGFAANNQGKLVAAAIAAELTDQRAPTAWYANTCYSLLAPDYGISVAGVYRAEQGRLVDLPHSVGVSPLDAPPAHRAAEARHGAAWYAAISADIWDR